MPTDKVTSMMENYTIPSIWNYTQFLIEQELCILSDGLLPGLHKSRYRPTTFTMIVKLMPKCSINPLREQQNLIPFNKKIKTQLLSKSHN